MEKIQFGNDEYEVDYDADIDSFWITYYELDGDEVFPSQHIKDCLFERLGEQLSQNASDAQ